MALTQFFQVLLLGYGVWGVLLSFCFFGKTKQKKHSLSLSPLISYAYACGVIV